MIGLSAGDGRVYNKRVVALSRRGLAGLAGGAAAGVVSLPAAGGALPPPNGGPRPRDWRALARAIDGDVVLPEEGDFDRLRRLRNTRFDPVEPRAVVRVRGAGDVAEALRFARRFGLPLRARAGGHSYVGDSTVAGGLVVDVRRLRGVRYDPGDREVRVGAGVATGRLARSLAGRGRAVPVGTCPTVGLVGLALGGGLGIDSRRYGLTCDALTRLTMVTADGRVRRVGPGDPLLWAARGGGGGTLGVVTSLRLRTHPARGMGVFAVVFRWRDADAAVRGWARYVGRAPRSVWCNLQLSLGPDGEPLVRVMGRCPPGQQGRRAADVERAVGRDALRGWTGRKSYLDAMAWFGGGWSAPRTLAVAGSDVVHTVTDGLAGSLAPLLAERSGTPTTSSVILDPLTGAVQDRGPRATAFPWRRHVAELQWHVELPPGAPAAEVGAAQAWVARAHRAVAGPSVGAYVNRIEPDRRAADYHAGNLARLRRIKDRHDPAGVFRPLAP